MKCVTKSIKNMHKRLEARKALIAQRVVVSQCRMSLNFSASEASKAANTERLAEAQKTESQQLESYVHHWERDIEAARAERKGLKAKIDLLPYYDLKLEEELSAVNGHIKHLMKEAEGLIDEGVEEIIN